MTTGFLGMLNLQQGGTNKMSQFTTGHLQVKRAVCGVVFTEPQEEGSLMYSMTSWIRSKDPFNSEAGMEKVEGGPPEEKEQKREEVEKEKENVQKTLEERIGFLEKELEAAFAEISLRKEVESKFLAENEELRAENQHLSNIIGALQIDKKIEMEDLATKNDDLERTNEHLKQELCSQKVVLEQYKNELMEKDKSNIELTEKLEKIRQNKRKLEKFVKKKMEVIEQISEQTHELEKSLNEARINDLIRNGRYKCLLQELQSLKKEHLNKLSDLEQKNIQLREELEKVKSEKESMASITKERDSHKERVSHLSSSKEMSEERIVQFTKENVGLKDELLAANEIIPSLKEELEGGDKKKENRPGMRKVRVNRTSLEISTEMDIKDGQKADVQKDVRDNKSEEKVVEAEDQDANGRKAEKEEVGEASGVGQVLGWLLASKGALRDTNNRQEERKLQKETSTDEEKEEEEKQEEEKIAKRTTRKPIVFDLEPEKPKKAISSSDSSHITFQGSLANPVDENTIPHSEVMIKETIPYSFHVMCRICKYTFIAIRPNPIYICHYKMPSASLTTTITWRVSG
ncbi:restin homolog [Palaemon carinicauda]|uniref:restin homolog n=1 Tax=Palaemon carinicauda TaxID=392227 RepID=UPI0035B5D43E